MMNKKSKPLRKTGRLKKAQGGMTLLEVLVSMMVLAIGVLALLATQLRTVSGVREAESQTIVAQAVQNLIEGMLANPTSLTAVTDAEGNETGWNNRSYGDYIGSGNTKDKVTSSSGSDSKTFNKKQLAERQLNDFVEALSQGVSDAPVEYSIAQNGNDTVVTVTWRMDAEMSEAEEERAASALNVTDGLAEYTYTARVSP